MDTEELLTCTSCVHSFKTLTQHIMFASNEHRQCRKFIIKEVEISLVTGKPLNKIKHTLCSVARNSPSGCKQEARFWSPRRKQDLFKLIKRT